MPCCPACCPAAQVSISGAKSGRPILRKSQPVAGTARCSRIGLLAVVPSKRREEGDQKKGPGHEHQDQKPRIKHQGPQERSKLWEREGPPGQTNSSKSKRAAASYEE